jgi:PKHD-type hydroxylase
VLITIESVLNEHELAQVRRILERAECMPGQLSAGKRAAKVKNNSELRLETADLDRVNHIVMGNLVRNEVYRTAALPLRIAAPYYARYTEGMYYGPHVDDPVMGDGPRYRSDVSITVFLNAPTEYEGGALCIETEFGDQLVKLDAGDAVMYPSSSLHRVDPVLSGQRLAAITWVQSMVPSAQKRALLYSLAQARDELFADAAHARATSRVDQAYVNLIRMWSRI